jgi:hypothetical protein
MTIDPAAVMKEVEDYLVPRKQLSIREHALYYHLLRHTWLVDRPAHVFALAGLADALQISESTVRDDVRALHERGVIEIQERTRLGHRIALKLPADIPGVLPSIEQLPPVDLGALDFYTDRRYLRALLTREGSRCFYCLRSVTAETCALDHVVAQRERRDHTYQNVVVACLDCNSSKQAQDAQDFLRALYRRGLLSQAELDERLQSVAALRAGELRPDAALCR